jgi:hypothetical protein
LKEIEVITRKIQVPYQVWYEDSEKILLKVEPRVKKRERSLFKRSFGGCRKIKMVQIPTLPLQWTETPQAVICHLPSTQTHQDEVLFNHSKINQILMASVEVEIALIILQPGFNKEQQGCWNSAIVRCQIAPT